MLALTVWAGPVASQGSGKSMAGRPSGRVQPPGGPGRIWQGVTVTVAVMR